MRMQLFVLILPIFLTAQNLWADVVTERLRAYERAGARDFSASRGEHLWKKAFLDAKTGKPRSCTTCHTDDLRGMGKHVRTGKAIEPMAPSVNGKRLSDPKFIEKWFTRNCKWTIGRECTPQEKGDLLMFLRGE